MASSVKLVQAKFLDGPLAGRVMTVTTEQDYVNVGPKGSPFFRYSYAGKEGRVKLFAKLPNQRQVRKMILWYVGKFGRDPRHERAQVLRQPAKRTTPSKVGQGARRRAAKREASREA